MTDMHRALNDLLQPSGLEATVFPPTSRYHGLPVKTFVGADGRETAYVGRRFLPAHDQLQALQEYTVTQGDRIDNLASRFIGDPEQFWRIADANTELDPQRLTTEVGRRIRIALPEGIPGASPNA